MNFKETYWRIPGRWQANDIRQRSTAITSIIEGTFVVNDNTNATSRVDDSSDEDVCDTLDKIRKSLVQNFKNDLEKTNSSTVAKDSDNKKNVGFNEKADRNKRKFLSDHSDVEEECTSVKKKITLDDADEDDSIKKNTLSKKSKRMLLEDSDEEVAPISKKVMLVDSDDDDNSMEINTVSMEKKRTLGDSNEEDDPCPIRKKKQLIYSDEEVSDEKKNKSVKIIRKLESSEDDFSPIKKRVSSVNNDGNGLEKNKVSKKNKRTWLEDSSDDEIEVDLSKKKVSPVNSIKDENEINSSSTSYTKTLDHSDDDDSSIPVQKIIPLSDTKNKNRTENSINLKEKEKYILEDSALLVKKVSSSSINQSESDTEECNVSINERKQFEDSDEEDNAIPIVKKVLLSSSTNNEDSEEGIILIKKKTKILEDSDEEDNVLKMKEVLSISINKNKSDTEISTISNKKTFLEDSDEEDDIVTLNTSVSLKKSEKKDVDKSIVLMNDKIILENSYRDEVKEKLLLANNTDNGASSVEKNNLSPKNTNSFCENGDKESSHNIIDTESQMNNSDSREMEDNKNN